MKLNHFSFYLLISSFIFLFSCSEKKNSENKTDSSITKKEMVNSNKISLRVFESDATIRNEFQFEISVNGQPFILQKNIPAISGNHPFRSENDARKVGELMKYKLENNISPPAISIHELDSLQIKYN